MKIERIELKLVMNTKRRNYTSSQVEMKEHNLTLRNNKEVHVFDDMIEDHALFEGIFKSWITEHLMEESMYGSPIEDHLFEEEIPESLIAKHVLEEDVYESLIAEHVLEEDVYESLIAEHVLEEDLFDSLIAEQLHKEDIINDAIEYQEADDCDYDPDYYYDPYENEIAIDLVVNLQQFEYDDSEESSCCFEMGYYNDGDGSGIFGAYEDMYHPEFVPSFRHINNF